MTRGVVFDLDDTLYDERDYVRSGFAHVARVHARTESEERELSGWLWERFEAGGRGDTFDRLLTAFPDLAGRTSVMGLVDSYRAHTPTIAFGQGVEDVLAALRTRGLRLAVLSDGPAESQRAKALALELHRWFEPVILTGVLGPDFAKPSEAGFQRIAAAWRLPGPELAYVADNPEKDFAGPRGLGWLTIRLRHRGQLRSGLEASSAADEADVEIGSIAQLIGSLR